MGFFFQAEDGIRDLVRSRGLGDVYKRQVLVSSHQLSEIALMASDLVVIGQGRLIEQGTVTELSLIHI